MVLQRTEPTEEQINQEQNHQEQLQKSVLDSLKDTQVMSDVIKSLDLSPEPEVKQEVPVKKTAIRKEPEPQPEPEPEIDSQEEQESEVEQEQDSQQQSDDEQELEEEEEVIPKSKVQRRFDELTARLKAQQQELEELKNSRVEPKDEITKQLEGMSIDQLKAAKLEVRKAQIKAQNDDNRLNELLDLEDKIDSVITNAPKNFAKQQLEAFQKKASQIASSGEIKDMDKNAPAILKIANEIYNQYSILQKDVNGQATALELAVKHFKAINSVPGDRSKETELKRQVNNLKRKTTLDTKSVKINADKAKLDSLKKAAMGGTMQQKVSLVRSHPAFNVDSMIPDEFKQ